MAAYLPPIYLISPSFRIIWRQKVAMFFLHILQVATFSSEAEPGCMGFVMATFYLLNWPDEDIRQISLEV